MIDRFDNILTFCVKTIFPENDEKRKKVMELILFLYLLEDGKDGNSLFNSLYNGEKLTKINTANKSSFYVFCFCMIKADQNNFYNSFDSNLVNMISKYQDEPSNLPIVRNFINLLEFLEKTFIDLKCLKLEEILHI